MAQEIQIVPKYLHSHVETYVNDYTEFEDEASTPVDTNNKFLCVFRSSKGPDNVLIKKDDLSDFKKTYGSSDYSKYGQPLMMPLAILRSGNATVHCMRVMPDDAYAANCILSMLYKADTTTGKFQVKYKASFISKDVFSSPAFYKDSKTFKKQLKLYAQALRTTEPDEDGFIQVPLVTFRMSGRGTYGNDYRWRIARNIEYEMDYGIMLYSFEALSTTNGLEKAATYVGSLVTSSKYAKKLTLINDVLDDAEVGAAVMDVQVFEEYFTEVYDAYAKFVNELDESLQDDLPSIDEFDIFFGKKVGTDEENTNIEILAESEEDGTINVDRPQGVTLAGGDDGAFAGNDPQKVYRAEIEAYCNAFDGVYDNSILSTRRVECDALLDANYPFEVKQHLYDLAVVRDSALLYLDAGIETTAAQVDDMIEEYSIFNTRTCAKEFQHYTVKDPDTAKRVEVSTTYFFAQQLPKHYKNYGSYIPFVKSYAQLSGHLKNTLQPCIDDIDMELKELLYTNRFNYFETIEENVYQRCSQNTAQMINSDLMEENNMNTLFELKKQLERDCWERLYDFTSAEDRERFSQVEKARFSSWIGTRLDTLNIKFDVNQWEGERSIVHCYADAQFRNLNKRTIIEIDVNKRNFLG